MKKKLFKNRLQMIIYLVLMEIMLFLFIIIGTYDFAKDVPSDAVKFHQIFSNVDQDNVFKFGNVSDANVLINGKNNSGIILFGFENNVWTGYYAKYINEVAREFEIKEILYYDFENDRDENNGTYETIVNSLNVYTTYNDYNTSDLYAPTLVVVKEGKVIAFVDETALRIGSVTPEVYWQDYQIENFKNTLRVIFKEYRGQE